MDEPALGGRILTLERMAGSGELLVHHELLGHRTSDFRLQTTDYGLQTSDYRLRTSDFRLWPAVTTSRCPPRNPAGDSTKSRNHGFHGSPRFPQTRAERATG